jgi:hypothetical protein
MAHGDPLGTEEKKNYPIRFFNKFTIIVTISGSDFQSMIGGNLSEEGRRKREEKGGNSPRLSYFSTMASTGHTSEQLPHSVHFSSLIT